MHTYKVSIMHDKPNCFFAKTRRAPDIQSNAIRRLSIEEQEKRTGSLEQLMKGALLPVHTKMYLEKTKLNSPLILSVIHDDECSLSELSSKSHFDELKELLIIAAFLGSSRCVKYLNRNRNIDIDEAVLNMAILSGHYVDKGLDLFGQALPSSLSLRYALKSENPMILRQVLDLNPNLGLRPEHLVAAASTGNLGMFDLILSRGVIPQGKLILRYAAKYPGIMERLIEQFGYENPKADDAVRLSPR